MSIIIEGIKMPKEGNYEARLNVNRDGTALLFLYGECGGHAAKEIPPHGRLIDADALMRDIQEHDYLVTDCFNTSDRGMFTLGIRYAIMEAAQTILDSDNNVPCKKDVKE